MDGAPESDAGPNATRVLCGDFEWDVRLDHPLFRDLPEDIVVRGIFEHPDAHLFRAVIELNAGEQAGSAPGAAAVADRMGEVLFVSPLRALTANRPQLWVCLLPYQTAVCPGP